LTIANYFIVFYSDKIRSEAAVFYFVLRERIFVGRSLFTESVRRKQVAQKRF